MATTRARAVWLGPGLADRCKGRNIVTHHDGDVYGKRLAGGTLLTHDQDGRYVPEAAEVLAAPRAEDTDPRNGELDTIFDRASFDDDGDVAGHGPCAW